MKNKIIKYFTGLCAIAFALTSCKKEYDNIFNMFDDVQVEFHNNGDNNVVDYKKVNVGEEVVIDYTITSKKHSMFTVCEFETSSAIPTKKVTTPAQRLSYTGQIKFTPNRVGRITYRIWAQDSAGVYIGDGYKKVTIDITSDYNYYVTRLISVADTVDKDVKCFINLRTGALFSYNEAKIHPEEIDAGISFDPTLNQNSSGTKLGAFWIYALTDNKFGPYDVSSWPKRAVVFSNRSNNQASTWTGQLRTGKDLGSKAGNPSNKSVQLTNFSNNAVTTAANLVYFKTPEGKAGALYVNYVTDHSYKKGTIMSVDIKIQR